MIAVAFLAIAFTPIRHAGEIKPYATDFLVALGLIALAVEWLRARHRTGFLWGVAARPACDRVVVPGRFRRRERWPRSRGTGLQVTFGACALAARRLCSGEAGVFYWLLRHVAASQSASVAHWMSVYWPGPFLLDCRWPSSSGSREHTPARCLRIRPVEITERA